MTLHLLSISLVHWLVIASVVVAISGGLSYLRAVVAGRAKPNRVTWALWAVIPTLSFFAALSAHADPWAVARVLAAGLMPLFILTFSLLNSESYWRLSAFDIACGALAVLALSLWALAHSPTTAVLLLALANGCAALPTIVKAWRFPETENGLTYVAAFTSTVLALPAIRSWDIPNAGFQMSILATASVLIVAVYRRRFFR